LANSWIVRRVCRAAFSVWRDSGPVTEEIGSLGSLAVSPTGGSSADNELVPNKPMKRIISPKGTGFLVQGFTLQRLALLTQIQRASR